MRCSWNDWRASRWTLESIYRNELRPYPMICVSTFIQINNRNARIQEQRRENTALSTVFLCPAAELLRNTNCRFFPLPWRNNDVLAREFKSMRGVRKPLVPDPGVE